ncbi:ArsR/SmtB family transcription factor [Kribbella italica]|uniref:DNA-binding transcriptional ArsR family regulator n=1 Tax=Kribbella italica TaxID=1540520 RepID=A0A7W9MY94_9ACTN|nr:winged helix-turn-helix domain-containing protein [Kribbella italica]MBB5839913.1 DNA-binding transcriptional ArsR family regulator [Kribbella italica]
MLRIHFTSEDLMRVRLAAGPDPLWEAMLSAHQVDLVGGPVVFGEWRSRVRAVLSSEARVYLRLASQQGYTPDFLTSAGDAGELDEGLDSVVGTSTARFRNELGILGRQGEVSRWAADPPGSAGARRRLAAGLRAYHDEAIAPYWSALSRNVDTDIAARARILTGAGTAALLASVHPSITWREPVLTIDTRVERDLYLEGRGLTLQPAYFCWRTPFALAGAALAPVLVYPLRHRTSSLQSSRTDQHERALAALLGRTRGAVLVALTYGASTGELARQLGVSAPSASEHATVLREAGLVASRRERNSVWHTLTPLGHAVLDAATALPDAGQPSRVRSRA